MSDPTSNPDPLAAIDPAHAPYTIVPTPVPGVPPATRANEEGDHLDAANASLASALSVSFAVLRIVMLLLIAVFLLSGFFTIAPDEVAVRTRFGRIIPGSDGLEVLTPEGGPYFRWPAPVGQVYRVPTIPRQLKIDESFVFRAARQSKDRPLSELSQGPRLDPQYDGALLTADQSIVHARYAVSYKITAENAARFVRNVGSIQELDAAVGDRAAIFELADKVVRNAVEQAIVEDVAGTPLDRFLKGSLSETPAAPVDDATSKGADITPGDVTQNPGDDSLPASPVEAPPAGEPQPPSGGAPPTDAQQPAATDQPKSDGATPPDTGAEQDQVRVRAQSVLDGLNTGITLITVTRTEQTVPSSVVGFTNAVAVELSQAQTKRNQAERYRRNELIAAAGRAFDAILAIVDAYEEADRNRENEPEKFARAEAAITATFGGQELGPILQSLAEQQPQESTQRTRLESLAQQYAGDRLGGRAGNSVNSAAANATAYVATLEAEASRFEGMLALYQEHPDLVRRRMHTKALGNIFSSPDVETSFVAPGTELRLLLNRERQAELDDEQRARAARANTPNAGPLTPAPVGPAPAAGPPRGGRPPAGDDGHDH